MRRSGKVLSACLAIFGALCNVVASPAFAMPMPPARAVMVPDVQESQMVKVHKRHNRHRHGHRVVDAPFTRVEAGRRYRSYNRINVGAPFTHIMAGRHGRRIIAPFVYLWIPR